MIRNEDENPLTIRKEQKLIRVLVIPNLVKQYDSAQSSVTTLTEDDKQSSSMSVNLGPKPKPQKLQLIPQRSSAYHKLIGLPDEIRVDEINTGIILPRDEDMKSSIWKGVQDLDYHLKNVIKSDHGPPLSSTTKDPHSVITGLTDRALEHYECAVNSSSIRKDDPEDLKRDLHEKMCQRLSALSVDLIKNRSLTSTVLAKAQQADDYLSVIRESKSSTQDLFPKFIITKQLLFKVVFEKSLGLHKQVLCIPDLLLPSVIHSLHVSLGHSSKSATELYFKRFYYHRNVSRFIKSYCDSCVTCALATKHDIRKVLPSTERTLQPTRPRQYLYCDLIPMGPGPMSFILFCLDAYSQYIYAIPVKDKTSESILQGFLSLFATTGWPEAVYLDNETSFQKVSRILVKMAPVKVLFSTPYCQFQNWSENYIKNFKKAFLKIINDSENPQANHNWPLLLPTVAQALNRRIIPLVGLSREAIHFNMTSELHPLAYLSEEVASELPSPLQENRNVFQAVLDNRKKVRAASKKALPPKFHQTQLVFMKDQAPSTSTVLKIPNKGPYRIEKVEDRNVTLTDVENGKTVQSHVQNIRPMGLDEFKLLLNNDWDLNLHHQKAPQPSSEKGLFDEPDNPLPLDEVVRSETEQDSLPADDSLNRLFREPVQPLVQQERKPPDPRVDLVKLRLNPQELQQAREDSLNRLRPEPDSRCSSRAQKPTKAPPVAAPRKSARLNSRLASISCQSDSDSDSEEVNTSLFNSIHVLSDINQKASNSLKARSKKRISFYLTNLPPYLYPPETSGSDSDSDEDDQANRQHIRRDVFPSDPQRSDFYSSKAFA